MEKLAHKSGYHMKDANGKYAPQCTSGKKTDESNGNMVVPGPGQPDFQPANSQLAISNLPETPVDNFLARTNRGFGTGYERFEEGTHVVLFARAFLNRLPNVELTSDIDVVRLVQDMKLAGIEVRCRPRTPAIASDTPSIRVSIPPWMQDITCVTISTTAR